jgi:hypothetical protein
LARLLAALGLLAKGTKAGITAALMLVAAVAALVRLHQTRLNIRPLAAGMAWLHQLRERL